MEPVARQSHSFTYKGPTPDIGDLSCERRDGGVFSHWKPSTEELATLAAGGVVELGIYSESIPPVSVVVVAAEEKPQPESSEPAGQQASDAS